MRVIPFIVVIGLLLSGCASNRAEVSVSLTSTQALYRPSPSSQEQAYQEALTKGELHDALSIVDTVLRRRGFELLSEKVPGLWPLRREYTHPRSVGSPHSVGGYVAFLQEAGVTNGWLWVALKSRGLHPTPHPPGELAMQARDEIADEFVQRFGKERVSTRVGKSVGGSGGGFPLFLLPVH
jgi:hypothetical protein